MMVILIVIIFVIIIVAFCVPLERQQKQDEERRKQDVRLLSSSSKAADRGWNTSKLETARANRTLCELDYASASARAQAVYADGHRDDMQLITENIHDLEQDDWERKALKHLENFESNYEFILDHEDECDFKDIEELFRAKDRCVRAWQSYFSIDLEQYERIIYPKRFLREYMSDAYDPCMESSDALQKKLNAIIEEKRPEYRRKKKLDSAIMQYIQKHEPVKRADFLKMKFDGYTQRELQLCYQGLINKHRLVAIKYGDRYFVSLSDKEKASIANRKGD